MTEIDRAEIDRELADNRAVEELEDATEDKVVRGWANVVRKLQQGQDFAKVKAAIEKFATKFPEGDDKQACRILWARVNKAERLYQAPADDYSAVWSVVTDTWGHCPTALAHRMECRRREERLAAAHLAA